MRYQEIKPSASASRFVQCYWMLEDAAPESSVQRIVPDGRAELIVNLGLPYELRTEAGWKPQPQCFFFGQITGPLIVRPAGPTRMIGIRFHPHTAGRLLKVPICELTDMMVPVDALSAHLFRELEVLDEPCSLLKQGAALDRIVLAIGTPAEADDRLLSAAVSGLSEGNVSIETVAHRAGLSRRQFERRFLQAVGVPPKLFSRMQRFQRVFPALEGAELAWVDAAVQCGYYDQAHLLRDFREFAGKPPSTLLSQDSDLARHFVRCASMSHFSKTRSDTSR